MKKTPLLVPMMMCALSFCACSNDDAENGNTLVDGEVSVSKVFTNGVPQKAPGISHITVDSEGRVTSMQTDEGGRVEFTYDAKTRAASKNVTMSIYYDDYEPEVWYLTLGSNGFTVKAQDAEGYNFTTYAYNPNGQLTKFTLKDYNHTGNKDIDIDCELQFEYDTNGNMTKATYNEIESHPETTVYQFAYTDSTHTTSIPNKGCIFATSGDLTDFYDNEAESDLVRYAMYAGLLGKAQTNLILEYTYTSTDPDGDSEPDYGKKTFDWQLDDNGFPLSNNAYESMWKWR